MAATLFEVTDGIGIITLNRPDQYNAFNRAMALEVQQHLDTCKKQKDIRAVLLTGAGKAFCSGQDLNEVIDPDGPKLPVILAEHFNPIVRRIRKLDKPVVAAVNGVAAGAGANIALCCDIIVAAQSAAFIQAFSRIGLVPDSGGTFFLPRLVGWQKASALMLTGDKVPADEAQRMGMIYKVFADEAFAAESRKLAAHLATMPTKALAYTKQALNGSFSNHFEDQLHDEEILQQRAGATEDFKEGVQAFLDKRAPVFKGQ